MNALDDYVALCFDMHRTTYTKLEAIDKKSEAFFTWVDESVKGARATFNTPEIQLLPKTPAVKRTRQQRIKSDSDGEDVDGTRKRQRHGRNEKRTSSKRPKRVTRANPTREQPSDDVNAILPEDENEENIPIKPLNTTKNIQKKQTEVNEYPVPKPRTPIQEPVAASPLRQEKASPKPIPGFTGLNVKAKATAYEEFVSSPHTPKNNTNSETESPRQRNALCRVLENLRKTASPRRSPRSPQVKKDTPPQEIVSKTSSATITISHPNTQSKVEKEAKKNRRSSRKSIGVVSKALSVRPATIKRNRSINKGLPASIQRTLSKAKKSYHALTNTDLQKENHDEYNNNIDTKVVVSNEPSDAAPTSSGCAAPEPVPRTTVSKLKLNKAVTSQTSETQAEVPPVRTTRSKMRLNKAAPPKLGSMSSDDEHSSSAKLKTQTGTGPRIVSQKEDCGSSPSKKQRLQHIGKDSARDSDEKTPSPPCPSHKVVRGQTPTHSASFLNHLKKTVNTPSNLCSTINSFLKRNTPIKGTTIQDRELQKRREVEAKTKETEQRLNKRQELLQQRAEEQRRRREVRQAQAAERREQHQKKAIESRGENENLNKERKDIKARMQEEKQREDREKQKRNEKKMAEAEARRKQEEEARLQKLLDAENEGKILQEAQHKKRELEDAERQKRVAEQWRLDEDRRAEAIKERQREMERMHREAQEKTRLDTEKRQQREAELKRERQERERLETEERKERERQRMEELDKIREIERARLQAAASEETSKKEKAHQAVLKHNAAYQQSSSTNLNSTYLSPTKPRNPDSLEITPEKKPVKQYNAENYNIDNLGSDDTTDDETTPRQAMPSWASGANLKASLINQHYHPPNLDDLFCIVEVPDLNALFTRKKARFNKRTSSACWTSPIQKQ